MSEVGKKVVPDKGCLNRERPVAKAPEFPSCTGKSFFIRTGTESMRWITQRGRMTGTVAGYHQRNGKQRWLKACPFFKWEPMNLS